MTIEIASEFSTKICQSLSQWRDPDSWPDDCLRWARENGKTVFTAIDKTSLMEQWVGEHRQDAASIVLGAEVAIQYLQEERSPLTDEQAALYPNINNMSGETRSRMPTFTELVGNERLFENTMERMRHALLVGETTRNPDTYWYGFHLWVPSDKGLLAAFMSDFYGESSRDWAQGEAVPTVTDSFAEASHATHGPAQPNNFYLTLADRSGANFFDGYPGFSQLLRTSLGLN